MRRKSAYVYEAEVRSGIAAGEKTLERECFTSATKALRWSNRTLTGDDAWKHPRSLHDHVQALLLPPETVPYIDFHPETGEAMHCRRPNHVTTCLGDCVLDDSYARVRRITVH